MSRIKLTEEQKAILVATLLLVTIVVTTLILNRAI
jgi:hypothetical protein